MRQRYLEAEVSDGSKFRYSPYEGLQIKLSTMSQWVPGGYYITTHEERRVVAQLLIDSINEDLEDRGSHKSQMLSIRYGEPDTAAETRAAEISAPLKKMEELVVEELGKIDPSFQDQMDKLFADENTPEDHFKETR